MCIFIPNMKFLSNPVARRAVHRRRQRQTKRNCIISLVDKPNKLKTWAELKYIFCYNLLILVQEPPSPHIQMPNSMRNFTNQDLKKTFFFFIPRLVGNLLSVLLELSEYFKNNDIIQQCLQSLHFI